MDEVLKVLFLEDSPQDLEIITEALIENGFSLQMDSTCLEKEFISSLRRKKYDIILSDFKLPGFDAFTALRWSSEICPDTPLICVSGTVGEETAVELLKKGAVDYVLKDRLVRLPSAIRRALDEAREKEARKTAEEELATQHILLETLINSPGDLIIFTLDRNYCYTNFNDKHVEEMKKVWNVDIKTGMSLLECMHEPKLRDLARQSIDRVFNGDSFSEVQYQPDHNIYYEFNWNPVLQSNNVAGVAVTIRDISERKRVENDLRESEERFRSLFENSTVGIYRTTPSGEILLANPTMIDMLGYSSFEELSKRNLEQSGFEPSYKRSKFIDEIEQKGEIKGLESAWIRMDGKTVYVSESAKAIRNNDALTMYYDGIVEDITLRKKAEALRMESENRYRSLFGNMLNGVAYCRMIFVDDYAKDFVYLEVNDAFEKLTGLKNVVGKKVSEVIPGIWETDKELFDMYVRVSLTGIPEFMENYVEPLKMWFSISVYSTQKDYFVAVFDVITERKLAEEKILSLARFPSENPGPVLRVTDKGKLLYANDASYRLLNWKLETGSLVPPVLQNSINKALKEEKEKIFGTKHSNRYFLFTVVPVEGTGYINLYGKDVTEIRKAEEALRESEDKFKYIFDHSVIGKSITQPDGEIAVNQAFCDMMGYSPEELANTNWRDISHLDDIELTQKNVDLLISGECESAHFTKRYLHKNGSVIWTDVGTSLRRSADGKPLYFMTAINNITDRKTAEEALHELNEELENRVIARTEQLEEANKELEAFSYSVSHDLRAPLRSVHSYTKILVEEYENILDDEGKRLCGIISSSASQMGNLIDDLLNFSRIGRSSMEISLIDMNKIIGSVLNEITAMKENTGIKLNIGKLKKAYGDKALLSLVWTNLLSNAIKYSSKKEFPEISIWSQLSGDRIIYFTKDNGVGFDMIYKHKLFGVFQRLHSEKDFEGNGVGLAIVQRIITRHNGKVWAEGEVDNGATFCFSLPVGEVGSKK